MSTKAAKHGSGSVGDYASRIGFMQGRMSAPVDGRIQAFPWSSWQEEFLLAQKNDFHLMEWTLDQDHLYENPLLTPSGQDEICGLIQRYAVNVPSLTGDCFMQAPFWKARGVDYELLTRDFLAVAAACAKAGISMVVVPLVDNGRLQTLMQEDVLVEFLRSKKIHLNRLGLRVLFECDLEPMRLRQFVERFDAETFGINYDIGNSAALGFDPMEEIAAYGHRIFNVHVKDRKLGGTTVPLGTGAAAFRSAFAALKRVGYSGNFILQTARASDNDHVGALCRYRDMTNNWLRSTEAGEFAA